jgi:hypothetical protein
MSRGRKLLLVTLLLACGGASALLFLKPDAGQWLAGPASSTPEKSSEPPADVSVAKETPAAAAPTPVVKAEPPKKPVVPPITVTKTPPASVSKALGDSQGASAKSPAEAVASEPSTLKPPPWAVGAFPSRPVFGSAKTEPKGASSPAGTWPAAEPKAAGTTPKPGSQGDLFDRLGKGGPTTPREEKNAKPEPSTPATSPATSSAEGSDARIHTVRDGDTLRKLAERYLGDSSRFLEIYEINRQLLRSPEVLPIGARLSIPARGASSLIVRESIRVPAETASLPTLPTETATAPTGLRPLRPLRPLVPVPPDAFKRP